MTTGSSSDIQSRLKGVRPKGWWAWTAPLYDALAGGLSDVAAWCYGLIGYASAQTRLATAYGIWLDIFSYDFLGLNLTRSGILDDAFRALIRSTILQERVTRSGMVNAVTKLTTFAPWIFEPWNTYDTGAYSGAGIVCGQLGYGVGQGGYGNMNLPGQVFMQVSRGTPSGIPNVDGYGESVAGYGNGAIEYVGQSLSRTGITNAMINDLVSKTKPTGVIVWMTFKTPTGLLTTDAGAPLTDPASGAQLITP